MTSICLIVQSVYDSDPRVRRKAEALVAAGYGVDVLALQGARREARYTLNGVNVYTLALGRKRGSLFRYGFEYLVFFAWVLVRLPLMMRRRRYAIVDVNTLPDFLIFAAAMARWMGAALMLDMHEITPEFYMSKYGISERSAAVRLLKRLERASCLFADHVITINEPIRALLEQRGLPPSKTTIVMNAAEEDRFAEEPKAPMVRRGQGSSGFIMLYHGTLTRTYGLDLAVEAFAQAREQLPGAELWILGDGPERSSIAALAEQRGVSSRVKLIGPVPSSEIPDWLSRCDAGILPFRRDVFLEYAFPNKLAEFIVAGRPVLIARLRAVRYYFSERALAYFEPGDPSDLAHQMVRLFKDHGLRHQLAAQARLEYQPIRWSVMRQRYLALLDRFMEPVNHNAGRAKAAPATITR
jgi:glycosyltransferase involved in cell wall biosynthesis